MEAPNRERCWKCNGLGVEMERTYIKVPEFLDNVTVTEHLIRTTRNEERKTRCDACDGRGWLLCG